MCLRFWKLRAGGANKKRKIYYCRTMNSNVEVIGDMEPETALVFSAKAEGGYQPYVWESCRFVKHIGQRTPLERASGGAS